MSYGPWSCTGGGTAGAVQTVDPAAAIAAVSAGGTWNGSGYTYYTSGIFVTNAITVKNATIINTAFQGTATAVTSNTITFASLPTDMANALAIGTYYCQDAKQTQMPTPATVTSISGNTVTLSGVTPGPLTVGGVYRFAGEVAGGAPNFNANLEFDSVTGGTVQDLTLSGWYPNNLSFYAKLAACAALNFKSCSTFAISNILAMDTFADGYTFNFASGIGTPPCDSFTILGIATINAGREGMTPQAMTNSTINDFYVSNPTHNALDFESDLPNIGAGGLTFTNFKCDRGGIQFIEAILGDITFNGIDGVGVIKLVNAGATQHTITFENGTWAFPTYTGSLPCIDQVAGTMVFNNVTCTRVADHHAIQLPAWSVVQGQIVDQSANSIRQGYSYTLANAAPPAGFDGTSASTIHVQSTSNLPVPSGGVPVQVAISLATNKTHLGVVSYTSITGSPGGNHALNTLNNVAWVSGSGVIPAGSSTTNSPQILWTGNVVGGTLTFHNCTFTSDFLAVPGTDDSGLGLTHVYLTGNTNQGGGGLPTHCNGYSGHPLATGQLPVPNVPGYGTVHDPGSASGVCVVLPDLGVSRTSPPLNPPSSPPFDTLVADLMADKWAVLFAPSYPETDRSGVPVAGLVDDVSHDAGYGSQYRTTIGLWWDHVVAYCNIKWPGLDIAVMGFGEGGYQAINVARDRLSTIIGGVIVNPMTQWANVNPSFTTGFTFSSYTWTGMDADAHALDACTAPFLYQYGTADTTVGYNTAGTGGTPVSNSDAIITNAVAASQPITRRSTGNAHTFTSTDVTAWLAYFNGTLDLLRYDSIPYQIINPSKLGDMVSPHGTVTVTTPLATTIANYFFNQPKAFLPVGANGAAASGTATSVASYAAAYPLATVTWLCNSVGTNTQTGNPGISGLFGVGGTYYGSSSSDTSALPTGLKAIQYDPEGNAPIGDSPPQGNGTPYVESHALLTGDYSYVASAVAIAHAKGLKLIFTPSIDVGGPTPGGNAGTPNPSTSKYRTWLNASRGAWSSLGEDYYSIQSQQAQVSATWDVFVPAAVAQAKSAAPTIPVGIGIGINPANILVGSSTHTADTVANLVYAYTSGLAYGAAGFWHNVEEDVQAAVPTQVYVDALTAIYNAL